MLTLNKGTVVTCVLAACVVIHAVGSASLGNAIQRVNNTSFGEIETNSVSQVKGDAFPCNRKALLGGGWLSIRHSAPFF